MDQNKTPAMKKRKDNGRKRKNDWSVKKKSARDWKLSRSRERDRNR